VAAQDGQRAQRPINPGKTLRVVAKEAGVSKSTLHRTRSSIVPNGTIQKPSALAARPARHGPPATPPARPARRSPHDDKREPRLRHARRVRVVPTSLCGSRAASSRDSVKTRSRDAPLTAM